MKKNKLIVTIIIFFSIMLIHNNVKAVGVQANKGGGRLGGKTAREHFELIRQMEIAGGTLGKEAEFNTTSFEETGTGNGIDCHMVKNTEWGAAAIFAKSPLGDMTSSGNNSTGRYGSGLCDMTADGYEVTASTYSSQSRNYGDFNYISAKFLDVYANKVHLPGDGQDLYGIFNNFKIAINSNRPIYYRVGITRGDAYSVGDGSASACYFTRAVAVCGSGL